ncbi:MAG: hypothetical protein IKZ96_03015 [Bacilli bacterium]|nr:hypothetical protein [Bacilli bacterium]
MEFREKKLKELFKNYSISTLDSISFVLGEGKSKNKDILEALSDAYSEKSEIIIRDTSEEAVTKNFTLEEVKEDLFRMPDYASDLINKEIRKGFFKIQNRIKKSTNDEEIERLQKVLSEISGFLNNVKETEQTKIKIDDEIQKEYLDRKHNTWIDDNFSDEELEDFFKKFGVNELERVHNCFCCAYDYFSHRFFDILSRVQYKMLEEKGPDKPTKMHDYNCIVNKLGVLTDKEIELLKRGSIDSLNFALTKSRIDSDFDEVVRAFTYLSDSILKEEEFRVRETNSLNRLFKKLDRYDQIVLRIIFEYAAGYNLDKEKNMIEEYIENPYLKKLDPSKKLSSLTNKELEYLLELAENALSVLSREFNPELGAELNAVYYFEERLVEEVGLRESSKGKYNNLNNKKKTKKRKNVKKM